MNDAVSQALLDKVFGSANTITLNMNDVFAFACADDESIDASYWRLLVELYDRFGRSGDIALVSLIRGELPLKNNIDDTFKLAVKYIEKLDIDLAMVSDDYFDKHGFKREK